MFFFINKINIVHMTNILCVYTVCIYIYIYILYIYNIYIYVEGILPAKLCLVTLINLFQCL